MNVFLAPRFRADYEKRPLTLVDVGASGGMQAHWKIASPHLRFIGFEPDEREFENLRKKSDSRKAVYLNTALYDHAGEIELRLLKHQQVSSVFEPNQRIVSRFPDSDWFEEVRRVRVRVNTLDAELKANQIDDVDFVKLDVQGSGLAILKGADGLLRRSVFGLELEVEFLEIYKGQPLFADVDAFVKPYGFELFDLNGSYWKRTKGARLGRSRGQLSFADALYFRTVESLVETLRLFPSEEERRAKVLRAISATLVFGYADYALEIADAAREWLSAEDLAAIESALQPLRWSTLPLAGLPGAWRLTRLLRNLAARFNPTYRSWSTKDRGLGNND